MEISILVDNMTLTDHYLLGEPGFCAWLDDGETPVLFDTGYSGIFLHNGRRMHIDPLGAEYLVLSHGHLDHTRGLGPFLAARAEQEMEGKPPGSLTILSHPWAWRRRRTAKSGDIGPLIQPDVCRTTATVRTTREPFWITDDIVFLGEIPRTLSFEEWAPYAIIEEDDGPVPDSLIDDSAIACRTEEGLVLLTGCSHAGICNMVQYAKEVTGERQVTDIVGGLHLMRADGERIDETVRFLRNENLKELHACHCTGFSALHALSRDTPLKETGVGTVLRYP
jgi:7,8-dihydropterin-6-yl-methyl-4-(beta-D-ribofuranosyl)aminobenzene 5'-phosphate synthase